MYPRDLGRGPLHLTPADGRADGNESTKRNGMELALFLLLLLRASHHNHREGPLASQLSVLATFKTARSAPYFHSIKQLGHLQSIRYGLIRGARDMPRCEERQEREEGC